MSFHRPEFLFAIPAVWLILYLFLRTRARPEPSRTRRRLSLLTRGSMLSLLAVAAAGPHRTYTLVEARPTVHLPDRSGSVSPPGREEADRTGERLAASGPLKRIPFGDEEGSDARPALLRAAVSDPDRTVLQTDGHVAAGAGRLIADLAAAARPVGVLALESEAGEAAAAPPPALRLDVPAKIEEDVPFTVTVSAPGAEAVALGVDGKRVGRAPVVDGRAGFPDLKLAAGAHVLVAVAEAGAAKSAAARDVDVEGPLRVLVLGGGEEHPLASGLRAQGIRVSSAGPGGEISLSADDPRVIVVLPGFAAAESGPRLAAFVTGGGGLLFASGAPPGLARLSGEPLADILPATARPPEPEPAPPPEEPPPPAPDDPPAGARPAEVEKDAATLTLVLVVDRSGSMRGEKIGLARAACFLAAQTLDPVDRFGVLAFNDEVDWVHPISDHTDLGRFRRELLDLQASGGTEIFLALKTASEAILREETAVRHIILVSDGQDVLTGFNLLLESLRTQRVSVSTVGVGEDFEVNLLGTIARWGAGEFYPALDPKRLPQVVTQDTRRIVESARPPPPAKEPEPEDPTAGALAPETEPPEEEPDQPSPGAPVGVRAAAPLPFLSGLSFPDLPEVESVDVKFPAQVALETSDGTPALTFWRVGGGRVALWTADPAAWSDWEDLPRFAAQTVRMLAGRPAASKTPLPELELRGREVRVRARDGVPAAAVSFDGREETVSLIRTGPDSYRGEITSGAGGSTALVTARSAGGAAVRAATVLPVTPEASATGVDRVRMERLANRASRPAGELPPFPEPERRPGRDPAHLPFLLAALLLLPVDVGVRRAGR